MKKLFFALLVFISGGHLSFAQVKTTIREEVRSNSKGSYSCLVMDCPGVSSEKVKDVWDQYVKEFKGKTKHDNKNKETFTDDATIKEMSENSVDIYAKIEEKGDKGSEISVWFNLGATYVSQKEFPKQFEVANRLMEKFSKKLSADMLEDQLKEEEKTLRKMEDDLKDLEKDEKKSKKDIEEAKEQIKKAEEDIKKSEENIKTKVEEQGKKKTEIDTQKKKVSEIENTMKSMKGK